MILAAALAAFLAAQLPRVPNPAESPSPSIPTRVALPLATISADGMPPPANWFGGHNWQTTKVTWRIVGNKESPQVEVCRKEDFEECRLLFRFDPERVTLEMERFGDVELDAIDVSGVACVVDYGATGATLEYEIYCLAANGRIDLLAGAVALNESVKELLLARGQRTDLMPTIDLTSLELVESAASTGCVDRAGRRQGIWEFRQPSGARIAVGWRAGVPDGPLAYSDEQGKLGVLTSYSDGVVNSSIVLTANGTLRSAVVSLADGSNHRVVFYPSGLKRIEALSQSGSPIYQRQYSETGLLLSEDRSLQGVVGSKDCAPCLDAFRALHTRPQRR